MIGIYRVVNAATGKCYVGQSIHVEQRINEHLIDSHVKELKDDIKTYGRSCFYGEVLAECSVEELNDLEKYFIRKFNSDNSDFGYNKYSGGGHKPGYQHSPETRRKLSGRGYMFQGEKNPFYGRHHSEETKALIRAHMPDTTYNWRGKHHSEESRAKMHKPHVNAQGEKNHNWGKRGEDSYLYGYRAIYKGDVGKRVKPEDLQSYLDDGWTLGNRPNLMTDEKRKMYGEATKGRKMMNKDGVNTFVKSSEFDKYLSDGWVFGRVSVQKGEHDA